MPFDNLSLSTLRLPDPAYPAYPEELRTVGEHLRARRLDLGLYQREAAEHLGVTTETVCNWERERTDPTIRHWPAVVAFLGDYPFPTETTAEKLVAYRRREGLSLAELAGLVEADPATVSRWERRQEPRNRRSRSRLQKLLTEARGPE